MTPDVQVSRLKVAVQGPCGLWLLEEYTANNKNLQTMTCQNRLTQGRLFRTSISLSCLHGSFYVLLHDLTRLAGWQAKWALWFFSRVDWDKLKAGTLLHCSNTSLGVEGANLQAGDDPKLYSLTSLLTGLSAKLHFS